MRVSGRDENREAMGLHPEGGEAGAVLDRRYREKEGGRGVGWEV